MGPVKGGKGGTLKDADIATFGSLCVDIVLNVPTLPPANKVERKAYMEQIAASPPDKVGLCLKKFSFCLFLTHFECYSDCLWKFLGNLTVLIGFVI